MAQEIISALQFKNYEVNKMIYQSNDDKSDGGYNFCPSITCQISPEDESNFSVQLSFSVKSTEEHPFPFNLDVAITGHYSMSGNNENNVELMQENSVAILFPYLRTTISSITNLANVSPLILPTINIIELLKKNSKKDEQE